MLKTICLIALVTSQLGVLSQSQEEREFIQSVDSLILSNLKLDKKTFITYAVGNKVIVLEEKKAMLHFLNFMQGYISSQPVTKATIRSFFNKSNIRTGEYFSDTNYVNSCISSYVYLSVNKKGTKQFQFNLPFMLLCGDKKVKYPFDYETLKDLNLLLSRF